MIGEVIGDDVAAVLPPQWFIDARPVVVAKRVARAPADPLLDDVFGIVDVLVCQTRGDFLRASTKAVIFERRQCRRALFDLDELIQGIPVVGLRAVRSEISIRVNGST